MYEKLGPALRAYLESTPSDENVDVSFLMADGIDGDDGASGGGQPSYQDSRRVIEEAKTRAAERQAGLLSYLSSVADEGSGDERPRVDRYEPFWINNSVSAQLSRDVLDEVAARDDVVFVELNSVARLEELLDEDAQAGVALTAEEAQAFSQELLPTNDPVASRISWNVRLINAPALWKRGLTGEGVVVAVLDTGVDYRHPDLSGRMWDGGANFPLHGFDFASEDNNPLDEMHDQTPAGHGTGCAGIVVGDGASGFRTGVAPGCRVMAVRVGGGTEEQFWRAFTFALEQGAHVISMSLTWKFNVHPSYPLWRGVSQRVLAAGVLHANSSGNEGDVLGLFPIPFNVGAPADCPPPWLHPSQTIRGGLASAVACGNVDFGHGVLFETSGHGPAAWQEGPFTDYPFDDHELTGLIKPDICAPGLNSITTSFDFPGGAAVKPYRKAGGTSNATPQIAGCMALLAQACLRSDRPIIPARIQEALEMTAVPIAGQTAGQKENNVGAGRVDVAAAFDYGEQRDWWA